jgi:hypothetical protein
MAKGQKKSERLIITLTPDEKDRVMDFAESESVVMSRYFLAIILGHIDAKEYKQQSGVCNEL